MDISERKHQKESWGDLKSSDNNGIMTLEIYSDEVWRVKLESDNSVWIYLGALFVPSDSKGDFLDELNNLRCIEYKDWKYDKSLCLHPCRYHDKNNTEIHYKELHRSNARFRVAKNWVNHILRRVEVGDNKKLYINILGLNLSEMNLESFGNNDNDMVIYNRFYRTLLLSGLNYFFKNYGRVIVTKIYHNKGMQSSDKLFPWHSIREIQLSTERILILGKTIDFIDSDHRISK